jgi:hypothetical protein
MRNFLENEKEAVSCFVVRCTFAKVLTGKEVISKGAKPG